MKEKVCCICNKKFKGYGNNAMPYKEGVCCDRCNDEIVIPYRIELLLNSVNYKKDN